MLTKKYPYTAEGLKMKYGEDLRDVVLKDMKFCLGWAGTISKIIGKEAIIEEVEYTENPLEFKIILDNGLEVLGKRFGWFLNDYSFTFEKDGETFKFLANINSNQSFTKKLQDLYCTPEQLCLYYVNLYDPTACFSDDSRVWSTHDSYIRKAKEIYQTLDFYGQQKIRKHTDIFDDK